MSWPKDSDAIALLRWRAGPYTLRASHSLAANGVIGTLSETGRSATVVRFVCPFSESVPCSMLRKRWDMVLIKCVDTLGYLSLTYKQITPR